MAWTNARAKQAYERSRYHSKRADPAERLRLLVNDAAKRSKKLGTRVKLSKAWRLRALKQTHCAVTGIMFDLSVMRGRINQLAPSLDRIDPSKGYTDKNTRLVLYFVNTAKNDMTDAQFRTLVMVAASNMRH